MSPTQTVGTRLAIAAIRPDPNQPRHLFPRHLTEGLEQGQSPKQVIARLRELAAQETWLQAILSELDGLADSLALDGQLQPIRIAAQGEGRYLIEEGERRWWAHNILFYERGEARFGELDANVVGDDERQGSVLRRQVAENVMRAEFTAIELAQAYAARLSELRCEQPDAVQGDLERTVAKENGVSDRRVRQYLVLLNLSADVQELAQRHRLPERILRGLLKVKDPAKQLASAQRLVAPKPPRAHKDKTASKAKPTPPSKKSATPRPQPAVNLDRLVGFGHSLENANLKTLARSLGQTAKQDSAKRESLKRLYTLLQGALAG